MSNVSCTSAVANAGEGCIVAALLISQGSIQCACAIECAGTQQNAGARVFTRN
jgi:hypothetical protein